MNRLGDRHRSYRYGPSGRGDGFLAGELGPPQLGHRGRRWSYKMHDGPNDQPFPWMQDHVKGAQAWAAAQQSPPEPLTEDDLRSLMATSVFFVLGGGWLARYFRNRILRDRRPQLPSPPSGQYLIEDGLCYRSQGSSSR